MKGAAVCLAAVLFAAAAVGCGESSLPAAAACTAPTPTPTAGPGQAGSGSASRYLRTVQDGTGRLTLALTTFRGVYPDRTFYRSSQFRGDFVNYAGQATCTATALSALNLAANAPSRFKDFEATFKATLTDYAAAIIQGRDAVAQRNTSKYRDWWDSMDALELRIQAALQALQN